VVTAPLPLTPSSKPSGISLDERQGKMWHSGARKECAMKDGVNVTHSEIATSDPKMPAASSLAATPIG
jgi:hypothetical protein